jgi:hypothetical protein
MIGSQKKHTKEASAAGKSKKNEKCVCSSTKDKSIVACEFPVSIPSRHSAAAALMNDQTPSPIHPSSIFAMQFINRCTNNSISQPICWIGKECVSIPGSKEEDAAPVVTTQ